MNKKNRIVSILGTVALVVAALGLGGCATEVDEPPAPAPAPAQGEKEATPPAVSDGKVAAQARPVAGGTITCWEQPWIGRVCVYCTPNACTEFGDD
jgi:hypothetical protein